MSAGETPEKCVEKQEPVIKQPETVVEMPTVVTVSPVIPGQTIGKFRVGSQRFYQVEIRTLRLLMWNLLF